MGRVRGEEKFHKKDVDKKIALNCYSDNAVERECNIDDLCVRMEKTRKV